MKLGLKFFSVLGVVAILGTEVFSMDWEMTDQEETKEPLQKKLRVQAPSPVGKEEGAAAPSSPLPMDLHTEDVEEDDVPPVISTVSELDSFFRTSQSHPQRPLVLSLSAGFLDAFSLAPILSRMPYLRQVDLSYCRVDYWDLLLLTPGLAALSALEGISLYANRIGPDGCETLCRALVHPSSLRSLDLGCNPLGPEGVSRLAPLLLQASGLRTLRLEGVDMEDQGALALARVIPSTLEELDIRDNGIGKAMEEAFAEASRQGALPHLRILLLR